MSQVVAFNMPVEPLKPVVIDTDGLPMALFMFKYTHAGRTFIFNLPAYSWADAEQLRNSLASSISLEGEIEAQIDCNPLT